MTKKELLARLIQSIAESGDGPCFIMNEESAELTYLIMAEDVDPGCYRDVPTNSFILY